MKVKNISISRKVKIRVEDYTSNNIDYKNLHLLDLESEKPDWMPSVDEEYFVLNNFFLCPVKLENNKYLFTRKREPNFREDSKVIALIDLDILVLTQKYYYEKVKRDMQNPNSFIYKSPVTFLIRHNNKKIRRLVSDSMSRDQMALAKLIYGSEELAWVKHNELIKEIAYKENDLKLHNSDYKSIYMKGFETSFGSINVNKSLVEKLGVGVKLQNGKVIDDSEIKIIEKGVSSFYDTVINLKEWAINFNLTISFSKERKMYARDSVGIFIARYKVIGFSSKSGRIESTIAHEFAHFMDYYVGMQQDRLYSSDDSLSEIGIIARLYRSSLRDVLTSDYYNRTTECYARAIEQFHALKNNIVIENEKGIFVENDVFVQKIQPLIEGFLKKLQ